MSNRSEAVKKWRRATKNRVVTAMGGKCVICGYNKCMDALELHHIISHDKEFGLGKILGNPAAWLKIVDELRKCVLLCSNCHRELHKELVELPKNHASFNEDYVQYKYYDNLTGKCIICGKPTPLSNITCSSQCAAKRSRSIDWYNVNLVTKIQAGRTLNSIADELNISPASVSKRIKKYHPELYQEVRYISMHNKKCSVCGSKIRNSTKSGLCFICYNLKKRKVERPSKEILQEEIKTNSWLALARKYGVCDNAIRKWARNYQII